MVGESMFVLIHERMPHFKACIVQGFAGNCYSCDIRAESCASFSDYIDWHLISLRPSSLARVIGVINSLSPTKLERMRAQIRKIFVEFSSLEGVVNTTMRVLESRMLPIKARSYEQCNMMPERPISLPHLEPAPQLLMVVWSDSVNAVYTQQDLRQLAPSQLISSVTVIWRDDDNAPSHDG
ncbi:hypothetical protein OSTOST_18087 [Ostertagia ostertagi]